MKPLIALIKFLKLKRAAEYVAAVVYCLVTLLETPVFLMSHRKRLFAHKNLLVFWHWSFGHTVLGFDYIARLYHPQRISVIHLPHKRSNMLTGDCFPQLDTLVFKSAVLPHSLSFTCDNVRYRTVRALLLIVNAFQQSFHIPEHLNFYSILSLAKGQYMVGNEETDQLAPTTDHSGYVRLLHLGIGQPLELSAEKRQECTEAAKSVIPGFGDRPFVTVLLRGKGHGGPFDDANRCCGNQQNYRGTIQEIVNRGYTVILTGESDSEAFAGIDGCYPGNLIPVSAPLLNLFLTSECAFFIGQQSGPHVVPNAAGNPCLILDAWPHRLGTFSQADRILFKPLLQEADNRALTFKEIYRDKPELAFGYGYARNRVRIGENSSEDLLATTREFLDDLEQVNVDQDTDRQLKEAFLGLTDPRMPIHYQKNLPPLFQLRAQASSLLETTHVEN